jgi:RsiW-degrading membrane proteinase PrsW (M82 family)
MHPTPPAADPPPTSRNRLLHAGFLLVTGGLGLLSLATIGLLNTGFDALWAGMLMAVAPVPLYVALALWIDRYEPEPRRMLAYTFLWGATGAVFLSLVLNTANGILLSALGLGELTAALSAPWVEEGAKGIALLALYAWKADEFDNVTDGIVYASMVGLGFAMTENVSYYGAALATGGSEGAAVTLVVRGVMSPFAHPFFTAMTGIGLGIARETRTPWLRWTAPVAGLGMAILLHFLWNASATVSAAAYLGTFFFLMVPLFVGVLGLVCWSLAREADVIRVHLSDGRLDPHQVARVISTHRRWADAWRAFVHRGPAGWREVRAYHRAAGELAFHRWRVSRGITRGWPLDASREQAYLDQLLRGFPQH